MKIDPKDIDQAVCVCGARVLVISGRWLAEHKATAPVTLLDRNHQVIGDGTARQMLCPWSKALVTPDEDA